MGRGGIDGVAPRNLPNPVQKPKATEEAQATFRNIGGPQKSSSPNPSTTKASGSTPTLTPSTERNLISESRKLGASDVADLLMKLQQPLSSENKQLVNLMLQHGLEIDAKNFDKLQAVLKGKNPQQMESAVVAASKGIWNSSGGVDTLSKFLINNPSFSAHISSLIASATEMFKQLNSRTLGLDHSLSQSLAAVITEFSGDLEKILKKMKFDGDKLEKFARATLISDAKALLDFLSGIEEKYANSDKITTIQENFSNLKSKLKDVLQHLGAQTILSMYEQSRSAGKDIFSYWQLPNPMLNHKNIELIIKKDPYNVKHINPEKTRIVIGFETPSLEELTIIIDLEENKMWYEFQSANGEVRRIVAELSGDLKDRMETINYRIVGFKTSSKKTDIRKLVLPVLNLDTMNRIVADA